MAIVKCKNCGNSLSDQAPFCPKCGALTDKAVVVNNPVDQQLAETGQEQQIADSLHHQQSKSKWPLVWVITGAVAIFVALGVWCDWDPWLRYYELKNAGYGLSHGGNSYDSYYSNESSYRSDQQMNYNSSYNDYPSTDYNAGNVTSAETFEQLFDSPSTISSAITGKIIASADGNCVVDFRRSSRIKVFIKDNYQWYQFNGDSSDVTYDSNGDPYIFFPELSCSDLDLTVTGGLNKNVLLLIIGDDKFIYGNLEFVSKSEAQRMLEN